MNQTAKIFLFFFLSVTCAFAQTDSSGFYEYDYEEDYGIEIPTDSAYLSKDLAVQKIDRKKWEELTKDVDYSEEEIKKKEKKEKEKKKKEEKEYEEPDNSSLESIAAIGKIMMYLVGALLVGALIFIIVKLVTEGNINFKRDRKIKPGSVTYDLDKIEENLPDIELKTPIQQAIADGNFPLAVRLYYLAIIQELSAKEIISWKREKTNFEYIREMRGHNLSNDFRNVTQIFERVWYGDKEIDEVNFRAIQPAFLGLLEKARSATKIISG